MTACRPCHSDETRMLTVGASLNWPASLTNSSTQPRASRMAPMAARRSSLPWAVSRTSWRCWSRGWQPHEPLPESLVFAENGVVGRLLFMLELYQIFTTYYSMTMSPDHEPTAQEEVRRCLMCTEDVVSSWAGERVCKRCKSTAMWKQSGMGRTGHFSTFTRRPSTPP